MARQPLKGKTGEGKFVCGNCKWHRSVHPKLKQSCYEADISHKQKPCPVHQRGVGYFTPIDTGDLPSALDTIASGEQDDLAVLEAAIRDRKQVITRRAPSLFSVGDKVAVAREGVEYVGEVRAVSDSCLTVDVDGGRWRVLPSSAKKVG